MTQTLSNWLGSNLNLKYFLNLFLDNIIWLIIVFFLSILLLSFNSIRLFFILNRHNRETRGNGYGKHLADRYMELYLNKDSRSFANPFHVCFANRNQKGDFNINSQGQIDKELIKLKLLERKENELVFSKKGLDRYKNYLLFTLLKLFYIYIIGDNKNFYIKK